MGKSVVAGERAKRARQFAPSINLVIAKVHFAPAFKVKSLHFFNVFMSLLQQELGKSKWSSVDTLDKDVIPITSTEDVRKFLLNVQRLLRGILGFSSTCQRAKPPRSI